VIPIPAKILNILVYPGVVVHTCNPSTWEVEGGGSNFKTNLSLHSEKLSVEKGEREEEREGNEGRRKGGEGKGKWKEKSKEREKKRTFLSYLTIDSPMLGAGLAHRRNQMTRTLNESIFIICLYYA
jgi:hypothetical protein